MILLFLGTAGTWVQNVSHLLYDYRQTRRSFGLSHLDLIHSQIAVFFLPLNSRVSTSHTALIMLPHTMPSRLQSNLDVQSVEALAYTAGARRDRILVLKNFIPNSQGWATTKASSNGLDIFWFMLVKWILAARLC